MTQESNKPKSVHVHTVRSEETKSVSVGIFRNEKGELYFAAPQRSYKTPEQKKLESEDYAYSSSMYLRHADAVCEVIQNAKAWITEHAEAAEVSQ